MKKTLFVVTHLIENEDEFNPLRNMGYNKIRTIFFNPCSEKVKTTTILGKIKKEMGEIDIFFWKDIPPKETLEISKGVSKNSNLEINFSRITESLQLERIVID